MIVLTCANKRNKHRLLFGDASMIESMLRRIAANSTLLLSLSLACSSTIFIIDVAKSSW